MRQTRISGLITPKTPEYDYDKGVLQFLKRLKATNAEDDDFEGPIMQAKWTAWGATSGNFTNLPGWYHNTGGQWMSQSVPVGDWSIEAELMHGQPNAAGYIGASITLSTAVIPNPCTALVFEWGQRNNLAAHRAVIWKFVNNAWNKDWYEMQGTMFAPTKMTLKITKVGTTYYFYTAQNPCVVTEWNRIWTTANIEFVPAYFGIANDSYFNYFRRT